MIEDICTFAEDVDDGCTLAVRVRPGAKKNDVAGIHAGAVKISLTAPPVDGRANEELVGFIAELLRIPRARIAILTGATSPMKRLRITGKSASEVQAALFPVEFC